MRKSEGSVGLKLPQKIEIRKTSAADCYLTDDSENEFQQHHLLHPNPNSNASNSSGEFQKRNIGLMTNYNNNNNNVSGARPSGANMHIRGQKSTQHISIMLFAVSIGFVILNLPFAIRTLFQRQYQDDFKVISQISQKIISG
jgi:hypothetical protein